MTAESSANAIVDQLNLSAEAGALWQPGLDLSVFADALAARITRRCLTSGGSHPEKRRAVWWGCLCCWKCASEAAPPGACAGGGRPLGPGSWKTTLAVQTPAKPGTEAAGCPGACRHV